MLRYVCTNCYKTQVKEQLMVLSCVMAGSHGEETFSLDLEGSVKLCQTEKEKRKFLGRWKNMKTEKGIVLIV